MEEERLIEPAPDGGVVLRLPAVERELLQQLRSELVVLLETEPGDSSLERLFPPAYEDKRAEREYRRLMGAELLEGRRRALDVLEATAGQEQLSSEEAEAWLTALNDLRLVLGTRLDVREDTFEDGLDLKDPRAPELAVYSYLTWLQDALVAAVAALASDPNVLERSGRVFTTPELARDYGFTDVDGKQQSAFWDEHWAGTW